MKIYKNILMITAMLVLITSQGCDNGSENPSNEKVFMDKLNGEWTFTTGSASVDGMDVTRLFADMVITFHEDQTYSITNSLTPIWPASGSFTLEQGNNNLFNLRRDDGVLVRVRTLSDNAITLAFLYTSSSGRAKSISGEYEFVMNR